ncbi:MAG TPA: zinc-dependent metalloprotease [Puia sp.]|jgi:hypothetical protein
MKKYLIFLVLILVAGGISAQLPWEKKDEKKDDRLDSLLSMLKQTRKSKIRPYEKVITADAVSHKGLFTIHEVRDSFFIELPDTLLERRMVLIKRLVKGTLDGKVYPGEEIDDKGVYFAMGPDSSIYLFSNREKAQADSNSRLAKAVRDANTDAVLQTMNIVAFGPHHASYVFDATSLLKSNSELTSVKEKDATSKGFHVDYVHVYPINVEIGVYRMYGADQTPLVTNTSFVLLPRNPMRQRLLDRRLGYFASDVDYFTDDQRHVDTRAFIWRWRLEPRAEDMEKWKRGELVEPEHPIVIYIDPNTPKQWVKYLIQGVNDWQTAFEQAGFKNAIVGKEWPAGDSANLDDARYSFICYLPSGEANAYGPNVHDPRSGEIIQTHIGWFHNVMSLVHDWYLVQAGATDPKAHHVIYDEQLMGSLVRFVSSHEVGHTLGLRHNLGSSGMTPVEKMRDAAWLKQHGHTASIMDYARFNYVAQPEDNIPEELLWPHIGEYDRWAIEWGYKYADAATVEEEKKITGRWISERLAANPRLWYGNMEMDRKGNPAWSSDPRAQMEDLGDNNMTANAYGIKNLKRIVPNLPAWCHEAGGEYQNLESAYKAVKDQFRRYMTQVMVNIGGVERTYKSEDVPGDIYVPTSKAKQLEALSFFNDQLFNTPKWLLDPTVINKVSNPAEPDYVGDLQQRVINTLVDSSTFGRLSGNIAQFGPARSLSISEYVSTLHKYIWDGLATGGPMDSYRRNMQKSYIGAESDIVLSLQPAVAETDYAGVVRTDMARVQKEMTAALPKYTGLDREHLESQIAMVKKILDAKTDF